MKIPHPILVAKHFKPWKHEFWLALFHDSVEDGYLPNFVCKVWGSLDAVTRKKGEVYQSEYIPRCSSNPVARNVKLQDLNENMKRCSPSLRRRYTKALDFIQKSEGKPMQNTTEFHNPERNETISSEKVTVTTSKGKEFNPNRANERREANGRSSEMRP